MEKKPIIWHQYDINDMPDPHREILAYNGYHHNVALIDREDWGQGFCEWIQSWAYVSDLKATSKALDVAREALLEISGYDILKADAQTVRNIFDDSKYAADNALQEIENLMKGGK